MVLIADTAKVLKITRGTLYEKMKNMA